MWVKICGNTNVADAQAAADAGADALGIIFVPTSPRVVTRRRASEILAALPHTVLTVAVVADESPGFIKGLLRVCPFKAIQFHGNEGPEEVLAFKGKARLIKAIRVKGAESIEEIPRYQGVDSVLLDAYRPDRMGATGQTFHWDLVERAKGFGIPIVVAGGLTPSNVSDMIRQARPYGVDASSGVEISPGCKDPGLVREFIVSAKSAIM